MELSAFVVIVLCILFFVGGAVWLEIRSRKDKRPDGQREQSPPAGRTRYGRVTKGGRHMTSTAKQQRMIIREGK
jgi:hypothetical protein